MTRISYGEAHIIVDVVSHSKITSYDFKITRYKTMANIRVFYTWRMHNWWGEIVTS